MQAFASLSVGNGAVGGQVLAPTRKFQIRALQTRLAPPCHGPGAFGIIFGADPLSVEVEPGLAFQAPILS